MEDKIEAMREIEELIASRGEELVKEIRSIRKNSKQLVKICEALNRCLCSGGKIVWAGNGGSATQASHFATEFVGRYKKSRPPLRSVSLTSDGGILTCISNDYGYDNVLSRQVECWCDKQDVLIILSTSGNSRNIVNAAKVARSRGVMVVGLLGNSGGEAQEHCDLVFATSNKDTAIIQELHEHICHTVCDYIDRKYECD